MNIQNSGLDALKNISLTFIIDDSGSMGSPTTSKSKDLTSTFMKNKFNGFNPNYNLTRWDKVEDHIHLMLQIFMNTETGTIRISFMNRNDIISVNSYEKSKQEEINQVHQRISKIFSKSPSGSTPTMTCLKQALSINEPSIIYLLTDGVPTDTNIPSLCEFLKKRPNPKDSQIVIMSFTDKESEVSWIEEIKESAEYVFKQNHNSKSNEQCTDFTFCTVDMLVPMSLKLE